MVMGPGSVVGEAITKHSDVDAISFTGSVNIGRHIARIEKISATCNKPKTPERFLRAVAAIPSNPRLATT